MGNGRIRGFLGGLVLASAAGLQSGITTIPPELVRPVEHTLPAEQAAPSAHVLPIEQPLPLEHAEAPFEVPLDPDLNIET